MVRPTINSSKHYVQFSLGTVTGGTIENNKVADAVVANLVNLDNEVREGAVIKAVYIEFWVRTLDTASGSVILTVEKIPGASAASMSTTDSAGLFVYQNKKNIFYTTMGLVNDQNADAIPFIRMWIKIPKSKQRFGLGDRLNVNIHAQSLIDLGRCGFITYKEYY